MQTKKPVPSGVLSKVADVRAAYSDGRLCTYEPLKLAGVGFDYATPPTSWGPMMKT